MELSTFTSILYQRQPQGTRMWKNAERQHQKSAVFQPCPTSGHGDQKPSEDNSISIYNCAVFATHPGTGEHPRPPAAPAVIAPQDCEAPPQVYGRAWASFIVPCAVVAPGLPGPGQRLALIARPASSTSSSGLSWRCAFRRSSHGFCTWNTVYSVVLSV